MKIIPLFTLALALTSARSQTIGLLENAPGNMDGYLLFSPIPDTTTYLIDKCGRLVHTWTSGYKPGQSVYLLEDGSILRAGAFPSTNFNAGGRGGLVERIAWNGSVQWIYQISDASQCSHHDICPMPNGNVLVLAWEKHTVEEAIAQGRNPALLSNSLWSEKLIELEPVGDAQANILWEWHLWDHMVQDFNATDPNYGVIADHPELVDLNYGNGMAQADWIHANALDYNAELDQIMMSAHNFNELWVIDHSTTTPASASHTGGTQGHGGDLLYRWGNPEAYGRGTSANKKFFGQHNTRWIRPGLPRAGSILVFNNGAGRPDPPFSSVDILAAPVDSTGAYFIEGGAPFAPDTLEYRWTEPVPADLFAERISGAQALSNGGLLVCDGPAGSFFELDSNGVKDWRYISPVNVNGPMTQGDVATGNTVFRCTLIPLDHAGLVGHDLTAGAPIELQPLASTCTTLSVGDVASHAHVLSIAPVPASDHFRVSGIPVPCMIELFDIMGSKQRSWSVYRDDADLDLGAVPNGTYAVSVRNGIGRWTGRLVIAR